MVSSVSVNIQTTQSSSVPDHPMCHAPDGDGVPGHAGPVRVLGDHGGEDLLHVVAVGRGHLLLLLLLCI